METPDLEKFKLILRKFLKYLKILEASYQISNNWWVIWTILSTRKRKEKLPIELQQQDVGEKSRDLIINLERKKEELLFEQEELKGKIFIVQEQIDYFSRCATQLGLYCFNC